MLLLLFIFCRDVALLFVCRLLQQLQHAEPADQDVAPELQLSVPCRFCLNLRWQGRVCQHLRLLGETVSMMCAPAAFCEQGMYAWSCGSPPPSTPPKRAILAAAVLPAHPPLAALSLHLLLQEQTLLLQHGDLLLETIRALFLLRNRRHARGVMDGRVDRRWDPTGTRSDQSPALLFCHQSIISHPVDHWMSGGTSPYYRVFLYPFQLNSHLSKFLFAA